MKFDKVLKSAIPYVSTVKMDGANWLKNRSDRVYIKIPDAIGTVGIVVDDDMTLDDVLHVGTIGGRFAELVRAELPCPDAKASEIIRIFSDGDHEVYVKNNVFGQIEKSDSLAICTVPADDELGEEEIRALLVGYFAEEPEEMEVKAIIIDRRCEV